ncbi:Na+/H+ antiporter NhaA [Cellulomonas carbonis]|uniref:Na(+)/H(+) antiporter NhaA n=1 Tax=Cellulomonas carbonis T26 TaxID=947969 RepID=A0A0A0BQ97_9CELL|nr:Na+/H+ antiporter NhaA [Cellulomonas carbonis]KGM10146.1 Na(+)/H(+) antiporter NhaA [Cellulomonas carbonis T26]GGC08563.1 Na(+)/H(+) antiporter NhaA [Cellulomonas carbonis]
MNDRPRTFGVLSPGGLRNFADTLRAENTGALLLVVGAAVALVWANSPARDGYAALSGLVVGPHALHLDLTLAQWATDGLLAIFFFVVGLELKREMVEGQLRRPSTAIVPILAAVGGMAAPALLYTAVNALSADGAAQGWAIPVATDIAFAVAVLTLFGRRLPTALRAFLLTLAVVDDLLGIVVIAVFYSDGIAALWLGAALALAAAFAVVVRRSGSPWLLVPVAVATWGAMHASGVHATIAGVVLGFTVPVAARAGRERGLAEHYEHVWRPVSAGLAVPVFALFAAGVSLSPEALAGTVADPAAQGVAVGLLLGKPLGILTATYLLVRLTRANLDPSVRWADLAAVSVVAGIGFTVSLLIGELSFAETSPHAEHAKASILLSSLAAAAVSGVLLTWRSRVHAARQTRHLEQVPSV